MEVSLRGKRALVTGAGRGIGKQIVLALHEAGAHTIALERTKADLDLLSTECPEIQTVLCDISEDWNTTGDIIESLGPIDLLVNNAAIAIGGLIPDVTEDVWDRTFDTNVKAGFRIAQVVTKGMVERGKGGSIVNISSIASLRTLALHTVYGASKSAVDSITRSFANEFGKHQIRVNTIHPGIVCTETALKFWSQKDRREWMINRMPQGKFVDVKDIVNGVMYLLSDKASMINGASLPIEGGFLTT